MPTESCTIAHDAPPSSTQVRPLPDVFNAFVRGACAFDQELSVPLPALELPPMRQNLRVHLCNSSAETSTTIRARA